MFYDKRMFYVIMVMMMIFGFRDHLNSTGDILNLLFTIPGLLVAITFHEFAHAYAADKLGDDTPRSQGRLTLNPLAHMDPIGTVMLLFAGFGWGKPVEVNPRNYDRRMSMDKADAVVSIAGPLMNFFLAMVFTLIYCAMYKFASSNMMESTVYQVLMNIIAFTISINVGLGVFNLIPLPPLDGSKVIKPLLSFNIRTWFENNEQMIQIVFVLLWVFGILSIIITPAISVVTNGLLNLGGLIFNI